MHVRLKLKIVNKKEEEEEEFLHKFIKYKIHSSLSTSSFSSPVELAVSFSDCMQYTQH